VVRIDHHWSYVRAYVWRQFSAALFDRCRCPAAVAATGHTDMRRGFPGLSLQVHEVLKRDPHCGHLFVFRGRRSDLIKIIWHE